MYEDTRHMWELRNKEKLQEVAYKLNQATVRPLRGLMWEEHTEIKQKKRLDRYTTILWLVVFASMGIAMWATHEIYKAQALCIPKFG